MIFKETVVKNVDRSGAKLVRVIHTYSKLKRRFCSTGEYIKVSVKTIERWPVRIRGKRYRPTRPGFILRGLNNLTTYNKQMCGSIKLSIIENSMITLKKRGVIKSPHIRGPIGRPMRVKKFFYIFDTMF